jgi:hypothetical protein
MSCQSTTSSSDPYYGHEQTAKLCQRFVTHLFACPDYPPQSSSPGPAPSLGMFVAYALHTSVTFASLYLLQRLKQRFPAARGSSGHRLFLSAFMIASKVICDDTYSNKSWSIVGQGMFALREVNQMEREMCAYLDWELNVEPACLAEFERSVRGMFSGPPPYSDIVLPVPAIKPTSTFATGSQATITLAADEVPKRKQSAPATYSIPQSKAAIDAARRYPSPESSPESPSTPASSHSSTSSPEPSPEPRTPESIEEAHAKILQTQYSPHAMRDLAHGTSGNAALKAQAMVRALQAEPGAPQHISIAGPHYGSVHVDATSVKPRLAPGRSASAARFPAGAFAYAAPVAW